MKNRTPNYRYWIKSIEGRWPLADLYDAGRVVSHAEPIGSVLVPAIDYKKAHKLADLLEKENRDNRIFAGIYPAGISYADRSREVHGDYKKLAFLAFDSLALTFQADCPADLRAVIEVFAGQVQAQRGQQFSISSCGQTVMLGGSNV